MFPNHACRVSRCKTVRRSAALSKADDILDAVVLADSRVSGPLGASTGQKIKALLPVKGSPVVNHVLTALRDAPEVDRVCVVGPKEVRDASEMVDLWARDEGSRIANLHTGISSLGSATRRILICSCDLPFVSGKSISCLIQRAPSQLEVCVPLVRQFDFNKTFPRSRRNFTRFADGDVAVGHVLIVDTRSVTGNLSHLDVLFDRRISLGAAASCFGVVYAVRLALGQICVKDMEERASKITQCRCSTLAGCSPVLAYAIDTLADYRDACKRVQRKAGRAASLGGPAADSNMGSSPL